MSKLFARIPAFCNSLTRRHLEWVFKITFNSPRSVIIGALLLVSLAVATITTISFESDIFKLFPTRLPALRLLLDSMEWSGSAKEAYFLLEGDPATLPADAEKLAERLKQLKIANTPAFNKVTWRIYDQAEGKLFTDFVSYAVTEPQLFIAPQDATLLKKRLSADTFDASLKNLEAELAGQFGGVNSDLASADPLNLREFILPRLKAGSQGLDLDPASPYFLSRDGRLLIMIAEPAKAVQDVAFARQLVAGINESRKGVDAKVTCAGAHISAVLDEAEMKGGILSCILSSLVVVLLIFYSVYRRVLPTLLLPMIISVGVLMSLATAGLILPSIHIVSFAFMALIVGLGTDYSIHLYDRYHGERAAGKSSEEALRLAIIDTGHGLFTASITTALPFLALMVSDVRALYELGLLAGLGVIYSFYATLFFLPPLLLFMERRFPLSEFKPLPTLGLRRLWQFSTAKPRLVVAVFLIILSFFAISAFSVKFDGELKNLQPKHSEAFLTQEKIEKHLSLAPRQLMIAVEGKELGDVMARAGQIGELAERYQLAGKISAWSSLGKVINNRSEQEPIIRVLLDSSGINLSKKFEESLIKHGFDASAFRPFINAISSFCNAGITAESRAVAKLEASPLKAVVNRHLVHNTDGYHALLFIHYKDAGFTKTPFMEELSKIDFTARTSSVELISSQLAESVSHSFLWSFVIGGLLVIFLLVSHFETKRGVLYALFPVAGGALSMLAVMALFGMKLNFMNAMVLVTIVGMGSDYGLHIGHRVEGAGSKSEEHFAQAGRAVLLSALTTIAGFGSLAFADYPALASIGWATNLGVGFTVMLGLVVLPSIIRLIANKALNARTKT